MVREIWPLCFYAIIFINCPVNWTIFFVSGGHTRFLEGQKWFFFLAGQVAVGCTARLALLLSQENLGSSLRRCSQTSREDAPGAHWHLWAQAWICHQCAEHCQFQIKSELRSSSTVIHQAHWNWICMQWSICEQEWSTRGKNKGSFSSVFNI